MKIMLIKKKKLFVSYSHLNGLTDFGEIRYTDKSKFRVSYRLL